MNNLLIKIQTRAFLVCDSDKRRYVHANKINSYHNVLFLNFGRHMPLQAETLVQKMKDDPNIDIANDWKMVTIFIGGNDLCLACRQVHKYSAEQYTYFLQETLDILQRHLPRSLVNVVAILKVSELEHFNDLICKSIHL